MGPWATVIVIVATVVGVFFAVMGLRGLVQVLEGLSACCARCGRMTLLPLPLGSHECRRCHHGVLSLTHPLGGRARLRH